MSRSLQEAVAKFKAWAAGVPAEQRFGEWECDYPFWRTLLRCFHAALELDTPDALDAPDPGLIADILYAVGRDNEKEALIEELASRTEWFLAVLPAALASGDADVRWQFAKQLGTGRFDFALAEQTLLTLVADGHEYVSRMALQALGRLGSPHAEAMCERAWATGHEYQRIMAI